MKKIKIGILLFILTLLASVLLISSCSMLPDGVKNALGVGGMGAGDAQTPPTSPDPTEPEEPTHTHTAGEPVAENKTASTCTVKGSYDEVTYCTECGDELTRIRRESTLASHKSAAPVKENEVSATCTVRASYDEVVYCSEAGCGAQISRKTVTGSFAEHKAGKSVRENEVASSCIKAGSYDEVVYCTECEGKISTAKKSLPLAPHTAANPITENEIKATCIVRASYDEVVYCSVAECGAQISRKTVTGSFAEHKAGKSVRENEVASSCTKAGSYDEVIYCSVCKTEMSSTAHTLSLEPHTEGASVRENEVKSTCKSTGSYDEVVYCTECGVRISSSHKITPVSAHTAADPVMENEVASTCTVKGSCDEVTYCSACGAELSRVPKTLPYAPCTEGARVIVDEKPANCLMGGWYDEAIFCVECGVQLSLSRIYTDITVHTPAAAVKENEVADTCIAAGSYDEVVYCSVFGCRKELSREHFTGSIAPHTESDYVLDSENEPTCVDPGEEYMVCTVCDIELDRREVAPSGIHIFFGSFRENEIPPTCTESGSYQWVQHCRNCDATRPYETVIILPAHSFNGGKNCNVCGALKTESPGLYYGSNGDGTCYVSRGSCTDSYVVIPAMSPAGDTVVEIRGGFYLVEGISAITIPDTVRSIAAESFPTSAMEHSGGLYYVDGWVVGSDTGIAAAYILPGTVGIASKAFYNCSSLTDITFPSDIKYINNNAFEYANNITNVYISDISGWCNIEMVGDQLGCPQYLYLVDGSSCELIYNLVIPEGVVKIREYAFAGYKNILSVSLPEGLVEIGEKAFYDCAAMREIRIPASLERVGDEAFNFLSEVSGGTDVYISDIAAWCNISYAASENASVITPLLFGGKLYLVADGSPALLTSLVIPEGVANIPTGAFYGQRSITSLSLPSTLRTVEMRAFAGCGIEEVVIPDGVKLIGVSAFDGCSSLLRVYVGAGVTNIGLAAFRDCSSLESLTLPFVGEFADGSGATPLCHIFGGYSHLDNQRYLPKTLTYVRVMGECNIASFAFMTSQYLREIVIDRASIGASAFSACIGLVSVTLGEGVSSIGANAFSRCKGLTSVIFTDKINWFANGYGFHESELADPSDAAALLLGEYLAHEWINLS